MLQITELRKKDMRKAIQFAIKGMHFDWYMASKLELNLYGRYFWYLESNKATQMIALYDDDRLAGVLLARIKGEKLKYKSFGKYLYVKVFDFLQKKRYPLGAGTYEDTNKKMFRDYKKTHTPDGEILFLAADPDVKVKGVGTQLLDELARRETGKEIYLFTDSACTYQFYEHRGFARVCEENLILDFDGKKVSLDSYLYSKKL